MANELKKRFLRDIKSVMAPQVLVTVTQLPSGALETAVNTEKLGEKIGYILEAYDDDFGLRTAARMNGQSVIRIVGYVLV